MSSCLKSLSLTNEAEVWLLDLWQTIQGLDDWYDNDPILPIEKVTVIHNCLVGLHGNPFFLQNSSRLLPILNNFILKWCGANQIEEEGLNEHLPKAYMWRAGFYDVVLEVVSIVHGFTVAAQSSSYILKLYGESFDSYKKEFDNA
jgi:hypothetical protein